MSPAPFVLCPLLAFALLATPSYAQDPPPTTAERAPSSRDFAPLKERNRETLHTGEALTISGLEQGPNDLRAGTPALTRSDKAVTYVDPEELYRRKLAMYADHARFSSPPNVVATTSTLASGSAARAKRTEKEFELAPLPVFGLTPMWFGLGALVVALLAVLLSPRVMSRIAAREREARERALLASLAANPPPDEREDDDA